MFTGIVEEIGTIKSFIKQSNGADLVIEAKKVLEDTKLGDSICVNGVCQTVTELGTDFFAVKLSDETLNITTFSNIKTGDKVNLERALTLNTRLGGHLVSGHVENIAKLVEIKKLTDFYNMKFLFDENLLKYVIYKGSITINGISLTVSNISSNIIEVALIPHTFENTTMKYLKQGDSVNIETDIIAKYVENMLNKSNQSSKIDMNFLVENGFA